jgi:hypothetical protein
MITPTELALEKRLIPRYLRSQAQEESLYPTSQAEETDQATKQKKATSREPGQIICRQPNVPTYEILYMGHSQQ